ncbi:MAG: hypothetical protein U0V74_13170 [Chitinophagales bacterium]
MLQLIHALNSNERRYFKLYTGLQSGGKKYAALFDVLAEMQQYDAPAVCTKLNVSRKQLGDDKAYLEVILLKALQAYHANDNYRAQILNGLLEADIIAAKGLFTYALSHLQKLKRIFPEHGKDDLVYVMLLLKESNFKRRSIPGFFKGDAEGKADEISERLENVLVNTKLTILGIEMADLADDNTYIADKDVLRKAAGIIGKYHALEKERKFSVGAQITGCILLCNYYLHLGVDSKLALQHAQKGLHLFSAESKKFNELNSYNHYLLIMAMLQSYFALNNVKGCVESINRLKTFAAGKIPVALAKRASFSAIKFEILTATAAGNYTAALNVIRQTGEQAMQLTPFAEDAAVFTLFEAINLFHLQRYDEALQQLMILLASDAPDQRPETRLGARVLNLILQHELGNSISMPNYIRADARFFKTNKWVSEETELFMELIRYLTRSNNRSKLAEFKRKFEAIYDNRRLELIGHFVILPWLDRLY